VSGRNERGKLKGITCASMIAVYLCSTEGGITSTGTITTRIAAKSGTRFDLSSKVVIFQSSSSHSHTLSQTSAGHLLSHLSTLRNHNRQLWFVRLRRDLRRLDHADNLHAVDDASEDDVFVVEPVGGRTGDEELAAVRVLARVGHREEAGSVVLERKRLVVELAAVDRSQASAVAVDKVAALNHEVFDDAVKRTAFVAECNVGLFVFTSTKLSISREEGKMMREKEKEKRMGLTESSQQCVALCQRRVRI
jgi:hypothetical protein